MSIILNISMSGFLNIVNAVIYPSNPSWPGTTEIKYNEADNSAAFPDSYKQYIKNLKEKHPNWIFKAVYTGLDWNESVRHESYEVKTGISTVPDNYSAEWKKDGINHISDGSFVIASKKAVAYTMDPRNHLSDTSIFQFEALDFNSETSTETTISKVITGTPMSSFSTKYKKSDNMVDLEGDLTWSKIIIDAAKNSGGNGISAVFLASRMKQETGLDILGNGSINGSSVTYPGTYNFFNIGATPNSDGTGSVTNGLKYALDKGWITPKLSIDAGAKILWADWIKWGQNTVYFQKFDVSNVYGNAKHLYGTQYMTNILAPSSESQISYKAYLNSNLLDSNFVFYIPVYENMPDNVSPHPDSETSTVITGTDIVYLDDGEINGTDTFNVRSGPSTDYNIVRTITEAKEGAENRTKFTRTQVGTNGWDKIQFNDGTEGYIYQAYVKEYNYSHVTGITLNKANTTLKVGEITTLIATISPIDAYIKNVTWISSNSSVAKVDNAGKVTATSVGTANITATTLDGSKVATCVVTVEKTLASGISVQNTEYPVIVGNSLQLQPTVLPATATDKSYDISITDPTIAIVESGKIKGLKVGTTEVTLTTKDGSNKTCKFNLKVVENVVTINNLTVDNNSIITKISLGSTVSSIKGNIVTSHTKKLINSSGAVLSDTDKVGTGTKVQILNGTQIVQEYTIVIYGDISGDGEIDVVDLLMLKRKLTNKITLNTSGIKAANISKTGEEPDVTDLLRLKRHLTNKSLIVQ